MAAFDRLLDRGEPFSLVFETRNARGIQVPHIREWAEFIDARRDALASRLRAVALVSPSPTIRGAARVLFKWARPPFEHRIVDAAEDGQGYLGMISSASAGSMAPAIGLPQPTAVG